MEIKMSISLRLVFCISVLLHHSHSLQPDHATQHTEEASTTPFSSTLMPSTTTATTSVSNTDSPTITASTKQDTVTSTTTASPTSQASTTTFNNNSSIATTNEATNISSHTTQGWTTSTPTTPSTTSTTPSSTTTPSSISPVEIQVVPSYNVPQIALPCHLIPFSGYRYNNTFNYYVLAANSVWMHQPHAGDWLEIRSTLSQFDDQWKIRCVIGQDNVFVLANRTHVYSYHRSIGRWHNLTNGLNETKIVWCNSSLVHIYSMETGHLMRHDVLNSKIISSRTNKFPFDMQEANAVVVHHYWFISSTQHVYVLAEKPFNNSNRLNNTILLRSTTYSNSFNWVILDEWDPSTPASEEHPSHPPSISQTFTWSDSEDLLWLWRDLPNESRMWSYDIIKRSWKLHSSKKFTSDETTPLLAWSDKDINRVCVFSSLTNCSSAHSMSRVKCIPGEKSALPDSVVLSGTSSGVIETPVPTKPATGGRQPLKNKNRLNNSSKAKKPLRKIPKVQLLSTMKPRSEEPETPPTTPTSTTTSSTHPPTTTNHISASGSYEDSTMYGGTTEDPADEEMDGDELDMDLGSPWHDSESSVFNSIIFFATSVIAFCLVSLIWCVRHCAPFPKDTLLLGDPYPPSVRYTAIPDTIA